MQSVVRLAVLTLGVLGSLTVCAACGTSTTAATPTDAESDTADGAETLSDAVTATDGQAADATDTAADATPVDVQALCLQSVPNPVVFSPTVAGSAAMASVELQNCGLQGVCITGVELQLQSAYVGEYALMMQGMQTLCPGVDQTKGPSVTNPCCLAKGASVAMEVYFTPQYFASSPKTAQVWATSNAGKTIVLLQGMATKAP